MFADGFETRMSDLMDSIREMAPVSSPVSVKIKQVNTINLGLL